MGRGLPRHRHRHWKWRQVYLPAATCENHEHARRNDVRLSGKVFGDVASSYQTTVQVLSAHSSQRVVLVHNVQSLQRALL
jgi:hypothetical protein